MPLCSSDSLEKLWSPRGDHWSAGAPNGITVPQEIARPGGSGGGGVASGGSSDSSSSPPSPASPISRSPSNSSASPVATRIRRSYNGSTSPSPSSPTSQSRSSSRPVSPAAEEPPQKESRLSRIITWYPRLILRFLSHLLATLLYLTWSQVILIGPTLWLSAWLWIFWKVFQFPLTIVKWTLTALHTPASERARKKRTVVISGGSTIQALHLARNFYSAGARVVVCEVEGLFGLARFSTAVHKFYTVARPTHDQPQNYVKALCDIVEKEAAHYYIPVSSTTMAYYDALAKPHLETLNCTCFCPGVKEVWVLDDILEVLRRCQAINVPTPVFYPIASKEDVAQLYDSGLLRSGRHYLVNAGSAGCRERCQVLLPPHRGDMKMTQMEMSDQKPWVVVQDLSGDHFLTCTTVKEAQVVANVTCRVDKGSNGGLVPVDHPDISQWLQHFFSKCRVLRHVSGHVSFRFVVSDLSGTIVPLGCRVGVSMPYICYTNVHPRIVWKPCRHFSRQSSGPLVADAGRYWMHEAVISTLKHPSVEAVGRLIGTVLDKREALFVFWDPLPYCAYYHLQLPFKNVLGFVQGHYGQNGRNGFHRTMAAPAH